MSYQDIKVKGEQIRQLIDGETGAFHYPVVSSDGQHSRLKLTMLNIQTTDEDLMEIIANSAQELRERGYIPTLINMVSPVSGDEEDTRCRVTLTRSFTSGGDT